MIALFLYAVPAEDNDPVSVSDRRQTVGDGYGRPAACEALEAPSDQYLTLVVESGSRFVEDQDPGIFKEDPGDGYPLLLSAGELDSAFSDITVVAVLKFSYEAVGSCEFGGIDDLFLSRTGSAVSDVFAHGSAEEIYILLDDAYGFTQALERDLLYVLAVYRDLSPGNVVEPGDEIAEGGLAASARTDDRQVLAGLYVEIEARQDFVVVVRILEGYGLKIDRSVLNGKRDRSRVVLDVDGSVHDLNKPLDTGHAALELLCEFNYPSYRCDQGSYIEHVSHEVAGFDHALHEEDAARDDNDGIHKAVEKPRRGMEASHYHISLFLYGLEDGVALMELLKFRILGRKGLYDFLSQKAVLDPGIKLAYPEALLLEGRTHPVVKDRGNDRHQRQAGKDYERQGYAGHAEDHKGCRNLNEGDKELFRAVMGEFRYVEKVIRDPSHYLSDLGIGIVSIRELEEMGKGIIPHIGLDINAHDVAVCRHPEAGCGIDDPQYYVEGRKF